MRHAISFFLLAVPAAASADVTIPWQSIDAGSGFSSGGGFTLFGVTGQPDASVGLTMSGGTFTLTGGFLPALSVLTAGCNPADIGSQGGVTGPDRSLDNNDFVVFISLFFASDPHADVGIQGGEPGSDGLWNNNDFVAFIDAFFSGC